MVSIGRILEIWGKVILIEVILIALGFIGLTAYVWAQNKEIKRLKTELLEAEGYAEKRFMEALLLKKDKDELQSKIEELEENQ